MVQKLWAWMQRASVYVPSLVTLWQRLAAIKAAWSASSTTAETALTPTVEAATVTLTTLQQKAAAKRAAIEAKRQ